jgi:hypothetical protein
MKLARSSSQYKWQSWMRRQIREHQMNDIDDPDMIAYFLVKKLNSPFHSLILSRVLDQIKPHVKTWSVCEQWWKTGWHS